MATETTYHIVIKTPYGEPYAEAKVIAYSDIQALRSVLYDGKSHLRAPGGDNGHWHRIGAGDFEYRTTPIGPTYMQGAVDLVASVTAIS